MAFSVTIRTFQKFAVVLAVGNVSHQSQIKGYFQRLAHYSCSPQ